MQPAVPPPLPPPVVPPRRRVSLKLLFLVLLLLAAAFLGGYFPASLRARSAETSLRTAELDLRLANLHRRLGVAAEEAQRNNYATATAAAREFFDGCSAIVQTEAFATQPRTRAAIASYAGYRDEVMTQLATADPNVRARLAGMYLAMDGVLARRQ